MKDVDGGEISCLMCRQRVQVIVPAAKSSDLQIAATAAAAAVQVVCEQLKVQSQNDTAKLAEAKQMVYLKVRHSSYLFQAVTNL
jgi:hypothetical protein